MGNGYCFLIKLFPPPHPPLAVQTREELAVTWKTKTERLVAENTRLLEERSELHSRLTELASANASLTLALDTAQRLLASRPDSPDLSPRLARRTAEDLPGREPEPRETLPSPPASVPDQVQPGELQDKLQALVEQNARLVEELAKEREISERLAAQVDEIPGFIVKFVEQRQRIGEPMTSSPTDEPEDRKFLENPGKASDVPPRVDSQQTAMATTAIMSDFTGDMMHCPICFEAQEVFL